MQERDVSATKRAWNNRRLRVGDQLDSDSDEIYDRSKHGHPRSWTISGAARVAFEAVGRSSHHPTRESARELDAVAGVSASAMSAARDNVKGCALICIGTQPPTLHAFQGHVPSRLPSLHALPTTRLPSSSPLHPPPSCLELSSSSSADCCYDCCYH